MIHSLFRNRRLAAYLTGGNLMSGGCDAASASLGGVSVLLQIIAASL